MIRAIFYWKLGLHQPSVAKFGHFQTTKYPKVSVIDRSPRQLLCVITAGYIGI